MHWHPGGYGAGSQSCAPGKGGGVEEVKCLAAWGVEGRAPWKLAGAIFKEECATPQLVWFTVDFLLAPVSECMLCRAHATYEGCTGTFRPPPPGSSPDMWMTLLLFATRLILIVKFCSLLVLGAPVGVFGGLTKKQQQWAMWFDTCTCVQVLKSRRGLVEHFSAPGTRES